MRALSPDPADRMDGTAEFGELFLGELGNPREGRRSLARIIARLTSDEDDEGEPEGGAADRVWELDPAEGYLGSRTGHARACALGAASGLAVAAVSWALLGDLRIGSLLARVLTSAGIGVGAALAPQIGSALAAGGWLMLILNGTPLLDVLPVAICSFALLAAWWLVWGRLQPAGSAVFTAAAALALTCGDAPLLDVLPVAICSFALLAAWWLVWGRLQPAGSAVFTAAAALALTCGDAALAAPVAAALAAYFLTPSHAATSTAFGLGFAQLLLAAHAAAGALPLGVTAQALFSPSFLVPAAGFTAIAAAASWALDRACEARRDSRSTVLPTALYLLVPIASGALRYLAQPMEIAAVPPIEVAAAVGAGCLSSILIWICTFALGYRRETPEGDRS